MALAISEVSFPLTIPNISKLDRIQSSEIIILGIPWQVELLKEDYWLSILFRCAKKDNSSQWSYAAQTSAKLLSFDPDQYAFELQYEPHIFCNKGPILTRMYINWVELFEVKNSYVKNDTIKLEVNIKVVDPNDEKRSIVLFEPLDKCCEGSSTAEFQLTVTNIDALMAVQTPVFMMRNNPWILIAYKDRSNYLCVGLSTRNEKIFCTVQTTFKLMSTKPNVKSKKVVQDENVFYRGFQDVKSLSSWEDLFNPRNGYVNNDSVVIKVEIKMDKPHGTATVGKKRRAANSLEADANLIRLECAICTENINKDNASSTVCGHIFCTNCIKSVIKTRKLCPLCNTKLDLNKLFRVFLPIAN